MWKDHPKYSEVLMVSDKGEVYSKVKNKVLEPVVNQRHNNERQVRANNKCFLVKKLVAETFCEQSKGCGSVFRRNEDVSDNRAENLFWGRKSKDLTGKRFERLVVIAESEKDKNGIIRWQCQCDCGNSLTVYGNALRNGKTKSCGCLQKEHYNSNPGKVHGLHGSKEYRIWDSMIQRCHNPNNKAYPNYGGRGILVCDRWRESFEKFHEDMGLRPSDKHTIERLDNNCGYNPDNCVWADRYQQANNTSRNRYFTKDGKTLTLTQWSRELNMPYERLRYYVRAGYDFPTSVEKATRSLLKKHLE